MTTTRPTAEPRRKRTTRSRADRRRWATRMAEYGRQNKEAFYERLRNA